MDNENRGYPEDTERDEEENEVLEEGAEDGGVEIYSRSAIWGFTIFFSTVFGGVLMMMNLRNAGYKKAGVVVLLFSIAYTFLSIAVAGYANLGKYTGLIFNIAGGAILTEYFFKRYFPEDDYYPRPIWGALGVSLIIALGYALLILYIPGLREQLETK